MKLGGERNAAVLSELAYLCLTAPVGKVGTRSSLREVAIIILDEVISEYPKYSRGYCLKGQAILPPEHGGWADPTVSEDNIEVAYELFSKAEKLSCYEGMFLKGRLLVTSTPLHKSGRMSRVGLEKVKKAAKEGKIARAFVFLAVNYEYPEKYAPDLFKAYLQAEEMDRQKMILKLYKEAAKLGYAAALNDIGTSIELSYGGMKADFDDAKNYYLLAAKNGYIDAFENLGNLYETGMGQKNLNRLNLRKAIHFYRIGTTLRSVNCSHYLATLYDEGVEGVLSRNIFFAEHLYVFSMVLANDKHDEKMANLALRDLCRCYITLVKTNLPESLLCRRAMKHLNYLVGEKCVNRMLASVELCMVRALKERKKAPLEKLVHSRNSGRILRVARGVLKNGGRNIGGERERERRLLHLFGKRFHRVMTDFGMSKSQMSTHSRCRS